VHPRRVVAFPPSAGVVSPGVPCSPPRSDDTEDLPVQLFPVPAAAGPGRRISRQRRYCRARPHVALGDINAHGVPVHVLAQRIQDKELGCAASAWPWLSAFRFWSINAAAHRGQVAAAPPLGPQPVLESRCAHVHPVEQVTAVQPGGGRAGSAPPTGRGG
jgi:hypothetical protein